MKPRGIVAYCAMFLFLGWCAVTFRADIAQIDFAPVWAARDAVLLALLLSLFNYALRVLRWTVYLQKMGHSLSAGFSALTYIAGFAFTLSPGKVGEMVRGRYYLKSGIPLSTTAAAFFIERLMDLLAMIAIAMLALASSRAYANLIWVSALVICALFVVFAMTPWIRVFEFAHAASWFPEKFRKITDGILRTLMSAQVLLKPQILCIGFVIGLLAWGAEGTGLMLIGAIAPGVAMDWGTAAGIYSIAIIVGALSFLPGGLGSTEAVMVALLAAHGYSLPDAILLTVVCRVLTLWFAVLVGWIAVAILRYSPQFGEVLE
ncbi:uncharacterized protein (TIRG00374 family) [Oxalobacteraceae bacterium GrIS 2.11]